MSDPDDSNPLYFLEDVLIYQLRRASLKVDSAMTEAVAALGVRQIDAAILYLIDCSPGTTQSDIGRMLGVQRTNLHPIIKALEKLGFIDRKAADGRSNALYLTAPGQALHLRLSGIFLGIDEHYAGTLSTKERAILMKALRAMRDKPDWRNEQEAEV